MKIGNRKTKHQKREDSLFKNQITAIVIICCTIFTTTYGQEAIQGNTLHSSAETLSMLLEIANQMPQEVTFIYSEEYPVPYSDTLVCVWKYEYTVVIDDPALFVEQQVYPVYENQFMQDFDFSEYRHHLDTMIDVSTRAYNSWLAGMVKTIDYSFCYYDSLMNEPFSEVLFRLLPFDGENLSDQEENQEWFYSNNYGHLKVTITIENQKRYYDCIAF